jgi:hypothetical protein
MADYHCDQCGEDALEDRELAGCGDPRCCSPVWYGNCGCAGANLCNCNEAELHKGVDGKP